MINLPLPVVVSLILCFVLVRGWLTGVARPLLILLALCAAQAMIATLNDIVTNPFLVNLQVANASLIAAMAWVAYVTTTQRPYTRKWDGLHFVAGPAIMLVIANMLPAALDSILALWFAGHGIAILRSISKGPDALPNVPLESTETARKLWMGTALTLLATAAIDVFIFGAVIAGFGDLVPFIVNIISAVVLLCLGLIGLAQPVTHTVEHAPPPTTPKPADEEATALFARATALLESEKLYLDPDLNLTRLAHRLHVPVKKLSAAINQSTGENVSRLINGYRIQTVCADISDENVPITQAMFAAGFSTKSNFNTEFRRVTGQSPREWLQNRRNSAAMQR